MKTKIFALCALTLLLASAFCLALTPFSVAHSPPWTIPTWTYVAVTNDPIGVNQKLNIVFWLNQYPPTAVGKYGDRWSFSVIVTKPDGSKDTLGPFISDPVGSGYVAYSPNQVGKYSVVAKFAGKTIDGSPNGYSPGYGPASFGYANVGDTYQASESTPEIFTCQQQPIQPWQEPPLPTGYWTTPVNTMNYGWAPIVANWLAGAAQINGPTSNFGWGTAPESAHVVWNTPMWSGGIMDARTGSMNYETLHYEGLSFTPPIILDGRIYYNVQSLPREGWYCLDLYTGKTLYFHNTTGAVTGVGGGFGLTGLIGGEALAFGQVLNYQSPNQMGGYSYLWSTGPPANMFGGAVTTQDWMMFDAYSGNYICSIGNTTSPLIVDGKPVMTFGFFGPTPAMIGATGTQVYGKDGSITYYNMVNYGNAIRPNYRLQIWNTSQAIWYKSYLNSLQTGNNEYWMWRPFLNFTFDGTYGFSLNASIPAVQGSMLAIREGQFVIGGTSGKNNGTYVMQGNLWALSLKPGEEGKLLWNITYTPPQTVVADVVGGGLFGGGTMQGPTVDPEDNVFIFRESMTRRWWGFSLTNGQPLWGPTEPENPWNYYGMNSNIYNGLLLSSGGGMSGSDIIAYNITTGKIAWTYTPNQEGFESPYGKFPLSISTVADGKIYTYSREHHQIGTLWRGGYIRCIDAATGKELWKISSWGSGVVLSNGYLVGWNGYDNQIYCYGKGPSAITLAAPTSSIAQGSSVMIQGTISDQSVEAPEAAKKQGLTFAAAVSDADQRGYMEFLYMQQSMPTTAKGVPIRITAIDPNGNFQDLGIVTSDASGLFHIKWTPPVPGAYVVTAKFEGSKSYGPSSATCAIGVDSAPSAAIITPQPSTPPTSLPTQPVPTQSTAPTPTAAPPPTSGEQTTTYLAIGIAVVIIVAAAAALVLRRRK